MALGYYLVRMKGMMRNLNLLLYKCNLCNRQPIGGVEDAADRDIRDGEQGRQTAPHVAECPKGFQTGDAGRDDIPQLQTVQEFLSAPLLGDATG